MQEWKQTSYIWSYLTQSPLLCMYITAHTHTLPPCHLSDTTLHSTFKAWALTTAGTFEGNITRKCSHVCRYELRIINSACQRMWREEENLTSSSCHILTKNPTTPCHRYSQLANPYILTLTVHDFRATKYYSLWQTPSAKKTECNGVHIHAHT